VHLYLASLRVVAYRGWRASADKGSYMQETELQRPISVTVRTARQITGLGRSTIYKLIASGKLESITIGRRRLIHYRSLKELIAPRAA